MPPYKKYVSKKQMRWANSPTGRKKLGAKDVKGKNTATAGDFLPESVTKKRKG